jgi:hypothetical protein
MTINVIVALVGVYILFALITSNITERIAALLNQRGEKLYEGILQLVGDAKTLTATLGNTPDKLGPWGGDPKTALVNYMYSHPLIVNLSTPKGGKPAYIPTRTFTLSFIDGFRHFFDQDANKNKIQLPALLATPQELFSDFATRVDGLPDGPLKQSLTIAIREANQSSDALLKHIDEWFESGMQRVTGWYKRWSAGIVLAVGAVLVVLFNVDTFAIVRQLVHDQNVASAAAAMTKTLSISTSLTDALNQLVNANIPLSWQGSDFSGDTAIWNNLRWLTKLAGLAVTLAAVSLGAPFWFDLLQAIVPVRLTGDKPATTSPQTATPRDVRDVQSASTTGN